VDGDDDWIKRQEEIWPGWTWIKGQGWILKEFIQECEVEVLPEGVKCTCGTEVAHGRVPLDAHSDWCDLRRRK